MFAKLLVLIVLCAVLLPVLGGAFPNQYFQSLVKFFTPLMLPITTGTVAILYGNAIAHIASLILISGPQVMLAAFFLHASGFFFGYVLARMLGIDMASCQTISIEVGMQIIVIMYRSISKTEKLLILSKSDSLQRSTSIIECRKANAYS